MGKEVNPFNPADFGTRAEMGDQPPPKPGNRLKVPGMVVAAVGVILIANEIVSRVRMFVEEWGEAEEALEREIQAASLTDD